MDCHKSGGDGEGWFIIVGSVYDSLQSSIYAKATIKIYTENSGGGTLKGIIEVDSRGNFYTTENISFTNGLYASVIGTSGNETFMSMVVNSGQCNSCHGSSTGKIWAK